MHSEQPAKPIRGALVMLMMVAVMLPVNVEAEPVIDRIVAETSKATGENASYRPPSCSVEPKFYERLKNPKCDATVECGKDSFLHVEARSYDDPGKGGAAFATGTYACSNVEVSCGGTQECHEQSLATTKKSAPGACSGEAKEEWASDFEVSCWSEEVAEPTAPGGDDFVKPAYCPISVGGQYICIYVKDIVSFNADEHAPENSIPMSTPGFDFVHDGVLRVDPNQFPNSSGSIGVVRSLGNGLVFQVSCSEGQCVSETLYVEL